jgi:hypothetical protein
MNDYESIVINVFDLIYNQSSDKKQKLSSARSSGVQVNHYQKQMNSNDQTNTISIKNLLEMIFPKASRFHQT